MPIATLKDDVSCVDVCFRTNLIFFFKKKNKSDNQQVEAEFKRAPNPHGGTSAVSVHVTVVGDPVPPLPGNADPPS